MKPGDVVAIEGLKTRWVVQDVQWKTVLLKGPHKAGPATTKGVYKTVPIEKIVEPERRCTDQEMQNG